MLLGQKGPMKKNVVILMVTMSKKAFELFVKRMYLKMNGKLWHNRMVCR